MMHTVNTILNTVKNRVRRLRKKYWAWAYFRNTRITVHGKIKVLAPERIVFGENCFINENVLIDPGCGLRIGNNVVISPGAMILGSDLDYGRDIMDHTAGKIVIGDNVWIGAGSIILKNTTIGDGAVIGAGAVVTKDIPPNTVAAGNPARVIRKTTA